MTDSENFSDDEQQDPTMQEQGAFRLSMSATPPLVTDTAPDSPQPESELDAATAVEDDDDDDECEHGQAGCPGPGPHEDDEDEIECWACYQRREDEEQENDRVDEAVSEPEPEPEPEPESVAGSESTSSFVDKQEYAADEFVVPLTADVLETRLQKEGFVVVNRFYQSKREIEYMYLRADSEDEWERLQLVLRVAVGLLGFSPDIGATEDQYHAVVRIWRRPSDPEARIWSAGSRMDRAERKREG